MSAPATPPVDRRVTIILFPGFELLDVFGPVELLFLTPGITVEYAAPEAGPVASSQGVEVVAPVAFRDVVDPDILLVPGGIGTRALMDQEELHDWLRDVGGRARIVTSVCTGSALLARAGLLEGYRATSNKLSFAWVSSHGDDVTWVPKARWVEDRDRWTSSGVAAGMDMTAALIAHIAGPEAARTAAIQAELEVQSDPEHDVFAEIHGLV